jgi:hypothetical protein
MATLTGQYISQSYGGVISLSTNTGIVTGSSTQLQDGFGTNLGIYLNGSGQLSSSADIQVNGVKIGRGRNNPTSSIVINDILSFGAVPGVYNTILGSNSGYYMTGSDFNTIVGSDSMGKGWYVGSDNTAVGAGAGTNNSGGSNNTFIGRNAGCTFDPFGIIQGLKNGSYNIALGINNAAGTLTGNYNVFIGNFIPNVSAPITLELNNNIIIADGSGSIRARYNNGWVLSGGAVSASSFVATSFTGSLLGTASYANYASNSAFLNGYGSNDVVLKVGDSTITGSILVSGSFTVSGSVNQNISTITGSGPVSTRYLDCSLGSFFTILLHGGSTVNLVPSNIKPGMRISLRVQNAFDVASYLNLSSGVSGSSPIQYFTQPSGSAYVTTQKLNAVDILEFSSFNNNQLNLTSVMKDVINA